jgi:hypothetical protein
MALGACNLFGFWESSVPKGLVASLIVQVITPQFPVSSASSKHFVTCVSATTILQDIGE